MTEKSKKWLFLSGETYSELRPRLKAEPVATGEGALVSREAIRGDRFYSRNCLKCGLKAALFVFEQQHVIFSGVNARAAVARVLLSAVNRQHGYGRGLRIGRKKAAGVHHRAERNIPQIRRSPVIADNSIRQHCKRVRCVSEIGPLSLNAKAATAIGMIHEHQFAAISERFFERREFSWFGAEGLVVSGCCICKHEQAEVERGTP